MESVYFREALRLARKDAGLTQEDVSENTKTAAESVAVDAQTVSDIERGAKRNPGILTVARIVEGIGITLSSLFLRIEALQSSALARQTDTLQHNSAKEGRAIDFAIPSPSTEAERRLYRQLAERLLLAAGTGTTGKRFAQAQGTTGETPD